MAIADAGGTSYAEIVNTFISWTDGLKRVAVAAIIGEQQRVEEQAEPRMGLGGLLERVGGDEILGVE